MDPILPPLDDPQATLIDFVDFHHQHNPDRPWLVFSSRSSSNDPSSISFADFALASHRIAFEFRGDRVVREKEAVAVILQTDSVVYVAVLLGLLRAGYVVSPELTQSHCYAKIRDSLFRYLLATLLKAFTICFRQLHATA